MENNNKNNVSNGDVIKAIFTLIEGVAGIALSTMLLFYLS